MYSFFFGRPQWHGNTDTYVPGCALPSARVARYATPVGALPLDAGVLASLRATGAFDALAMRDDEARAASAQRTHTHKAFQSTADRTTEFTLTYI